MENLKGKTVVVTGAASGIGQYLALNLADEGCHLALSDINGEGLEETSALIKGDHIRLTRHVVDSGNREQVYGFAEDAAGKHGSVDIVINNAGTALDGRLEEVSIEEFEWIMGINFWGVVHGSMAFLPYLKQRTWAHISNISSVHGLFTNPGVGPYCSSKFAVRGFTMALSQELRGTEVSVSCVHPGGIRTGIVRNSRVAASVIPEQTRDEAQENFDRLIGRTSADEAAKIIIKGIKKNKKRILVGKDAYMFDFISRFSPVLWQRIMGWLPDYLDRKSQNE